MVGYVFIQLALCWVEGCGIASGRLKKCRVSGGVVLHLNLLQLNCSIDSLGGGHIIHPQSPSDIWTKKT